MLIVAPADDDVDAAGQRLAEAGHDALERLPSHDAGLAHRDVFEVPEILGDMPWHDIVVADDIVIGYGDDEGEGWCLVFGVWCSV